MPVLADMGIGFSTIIAIVALVFALLTYFRGGKYHDDEATKKFIDDKLGSKAENSAVEVLDTGLKNLDEKVDGTPEKTAVNAQAIRDVERRLDRLEAK